MSAPYLTPVIAIQCNSDVSDIPYVAIVWNSAISDVPDWEEKVYVGRVTGTSMVDAKAAQMEICVITAPAELMGHAVLTSGLPTADGEFNLSWKAYLDLVLVIRLSALGTQWRADMTHGQGDIIYPTSWTGWQYECITPGAGAAIEPTWWVGEGGTAQVGSATFAARQYIPAQVVGPIKPTVEISS